MRWYIKFVYLWKCLTFRHERRVQDKHCPQYKSLKRNYKTGSIPESQMRQTNRMDAEELFGASVVNNCISSCIRVYHTIYGTVSTREKVSPKYRYHGCDKSWSIIQPYLSRTRLPWKVSCMYIEITARNITPRVNFQSKVKGHALIYYTRVPE